MLDPLQPGARIGDLTIERLLGRGGFGAVYLARDGFIGRPVALKVVQAVEPAGNEERARVLREARAIGKLNSPHIVTLYKVHPPEEHGAWMFEMEYVEGGSLDALLAEGAPLALARAAAIAKDIAAALVCAHEAHVVHGDIKPGNVLLTGGGAKLADFGLARILGDVSGSLSSTGGDGPAGTPLYMAPEVHMGERPTPLSDVWSFGVVLYRMLAGRPPFRGRQFPALFYAIQHNDPAPPPTGTPPHLADLAFRCLAKPPRERPESFRRVLEALAAGPRAAPPPAARLRGPGLVGRERELARLSELVAAALDGRGGAAVLTGEAGVGKTALARRVREVGERGGMHWVEAQVTRMRGLVGPLLDAVREVVDEESLGPPDSELYGSAAPVVGALLAAETPVHLESRAQGLWALDHLLRGLTRDRPLGILVEDAHEADAEDLRVLEHLARRLPESGVLLLVTGRRQEGGGGLAGLASLQGVVHLELGPLAREDCYRLLQEWAGTPHISPEVAQRVLEASEGNPLFAAELFRHLERSDAVRLEEGRLRPGPAWEATTLPQRFRDLAANRLAGLDERDRTLLDIAAVDGTQFDGEAVAAMLGEPLLAVLRRLQRLFRTTGLIVPGPAGFSFASPVFRQAIYDDLAPELRRRLHLDLARHLEQRTGQVEPERVGLHWEHGGRPAEAAPYLLRAARAAADRQECQRAVDLSTRAGLRPDAVAPEDARREADLLLALADAYYGSGRVAEAEELFGRLVRAGEEGGDDRLRLRATVARDFLAYYQRGVGAVGEAEVRRAAEELPPCKEKGKARYLLGVIARFAGDLATAERRLRAAEEIFRSVGSDAMLSSTLDQLASIAQRRGRLAEAGPLYVEAARLSDRAGRRPNALASRVNAAGVALRLGDLEGIDRRIERYATELAVHGGRRLLGHVLAVLAHARYAVGDLRGAVRAVDESLALMQDIHYLPGLLAAHYRKAYLCAVQGALAAAARHTAQARDFAEREGARSDLLALGLLDALAALWRGDAERAAGLAEAALAAHDAGTGRFDETPLLAAVAVFFGLPCGLLGRTLASTRRPEGAQDPEVTVAARLEPALDAWAVDRRSVAPLREGSAFLRTEKSGDLRAELLVLAGCLEGEALRRDAQGEAAAQVLARALDAARRLGHVWYQAHLLRELDRLEPEAGHASRLRELLGGLLPGLGLGNDARPFYERWGLRP